MRNILDKKQLKKLKSLKHVISMNKLSLNIEKINGTVKCTESQDKKELQSFLTGAKYFKNYTQNYS